MNETVIKIQEGTAKSDSDLCSTCRNCQRIRNVNGIEKRLCHYPMRPMELTVRVDTCSTYSDRRLPHLSDFQEIAWEISIQGNRKIGFISPEDRRKAGISSAPLPPQRW